CGRGAAQPAPAVFLGNHDAKEAQLSHLWNQLRRETCRLVARRSSRRNLRLGKIADRVLEKFLLLREIKIHLILLSLRFIFALLPVASRLSPRDFNRLHKINDLFKGRAGCKDLLNSHLLESADVLLRNDSSAEDRDITR